jgi:hypothetical protein
LFLCFQYAVLAIGLILLIVPGVKRPEQHRE